MPNSVVFQITGDDSQLRKTINQLPGYLKTTGELGEKAGAKAFGQAGSTSGLAFEKMLKEASKNGSALGAKYGVDWVQGVDGKIRNSKGQLISASAIAAAGLEEGFNRSLLRLPGAFGSAGQKSASAFGSAITAGSSRFHRELAPPPTLTGIFSSAGLSAAKAFANPFYSTGKSIGGILKSSMGSIGQGIGQSIGTSLQQGVNASAKAALSGRNVAAQDTATRKNATLKISEKGDGALAESDKLTAQMAKLNKELGYVSTTAAATSAAYDLLSNGFSKNTEVVNIMSLALKAAAGSSVAVGEVTAGTGSLIKALKMEASDAGYVMQQMIGVVDVGAIKVEEYASLMGNLTPTLGGIGGNIKQQFEQANALIALSTASGVKAGAAINGLTQAYKAVLKPSKEAAEVASSLGITLTQEYLAKNGIMGVLGQIQQSDAAETLKEVRLAALAGGTALSDMGEKPSVNLKKLITIFGSVEGVAAVAVGTGLKGIAAVEQARKGIAKTDIDKKYQLVTDGIEAKQQALANKLIDFDAKIKSGGFGKALSKALDAVSDALTRVMDGVDRLGAKYDSLSATDKETVDNCIKVVAAVAAIGVALSALGVVVGLIGAGLGLFALPFVAPVLLVIAGTVAITTAFAVLLKKIGEFAVSAGQWSTNFGDSVVNGFNRAVDSVNKWAQDTDKAIYETMVSTEKNLKNGWRSALQATDDFVNNGVKSISQWIQSNKAAGDAITTYNKIVEAVSTNVGKFFNYIKDSAKYAFDGTIKAGNEMGAAISNVFTGMIDKIKEVGQWLLDLPGKVGEAAKSMGGLLPGGGAGVMQSLSPTIGNRTEQFSNLLSYKPIKGLQDGEAPRAGRDAHRGIDYDARAGYGAGAPVNAIYGGKASVQDWRGTDPRYGVAVVVSFVDEKGNKVSVRQGHLDPESVFKTLGLKASQSKMINAGTPLGVVAKMGMKEPDHMHVDVTKNGEKLLDPRSYMQSGLGQSGRRENQPGLGVRVLASQYQPGGGGDNGGLMDARGAKLSGKDMAVAIPGLNLPSGIPYGSLVEITNPKTGLKAIAKVLDQGGLADGRELDMTTAVSNAIKFSGLGVVSVRLVSLPKGKDPNKQYQFGRTNFVGGKMKGIGLGTGIRLDGGGFIKSEAEQSNSDSIANGFPSRDEDLLADASRPEVVSDSPQQIFKGNRFNRIVKEKTEDANESIRKAKRDIKKNRDALEALQAKPKVEHRRAMETRAKQIEALKAKLGNAEERLVDAEKKMGRILDRVEGEKAPTQKKAGNRKAITEVDGKVEIDKLSNQIDVISAEATAQLAAIESDVAIGTASEAQAIKARSGVSTKKALSLKGLYPKVKELLARFGQNDASYISLKVIEGTIFGGEAEGGRATTTQAESKITALEKRLLRIQNAADDARRKVDGRLATGVIKTPSEAAIIKDGIGNELSYQLKSVYNDAVGLMKVFKDDEPVARLRAITVAIRDQRIETLTTRKAMTTAQRELATTNIQALAGKPQEKADAAIANNTNFLSRGGDEVVGRARLLAIQEELDAEILQTLPAILKFNSLFTDPESVKVTKNLLQNIERIGAETNALERSTAIANIGGSRAATDKQKTKGDVAVRNVEQEKEAGLITEEAALKRILDIRLETNAAIQKSLPQLQKAHELSTDPAVREAYEAELQSLKEIGREAQIAAKQYKDTQQEQSVVGQAGRALQQGLIDIAGSAKNGFKDLGSILDTMLNKIADIAIQAAINGLLGSPGGGGKGGTGILGSIGKIFGFKDGGDVIGKGQGGSVNFPRGIKSVDEALRKEGSRGVIIAAQAGERVLNQKQSAIFRAMLKDGSWDKLSRVYGFAGGGDVGGVGGVASVPRAAAVAGKDAPRATVQVERINSVDYVSVSQLQSILNVQLPLTAKAGAAIVDRNMQNTSWRKSNNI